MRTGIFDNNMMVVFVEACFRAAVSLHFWLEIMDIGGNNAIFGGFILNANLLTHKGNAHFTRVCANVLVRNGVQVVGGSNPLAPTYPTCTC